jgi:hypothetical protein
MLTHKYGLQSIAPMSPLDVEWEAFRIGIEPPIGLGKRKHFWRAAMLSWPSLTISQKGTIEKVVTNQVNPWMKECIQAFCSTEFAVRRGDTIFRSIVLTGCGGAGKTQAAGLYAIGWWGCSPKNSIAILTSTTKEMIRHRIWPVIQHYRNTLQNTLTGQKLELGHMLDSQTTLQATKGDYKHAVFALAVAHGETQKALHNLKGMHAQRILLVVDEANGTPEAIFEAIPNLRKGCQDFTVIIIGNPTTRLDPHGRAAEPEDGWKSVGLNSKSWRTKAVSEWQIEGGVCLRFSGSESPNVKAGKNLYPYLYNVENWQAAQNHYGTFGYWSQDVGMWPPDGMSNTVFNEMLVERCEAVDHFTFLGPTITIAFLDSGFGGDACVLQFGELGDIGGKMGLQLSESLEIPISPEAEAHDVDYQIARRTIEECRNHGVEPTRFGLDATGIGRGVGAIIAAEWSPSIHYTVWGMAPSERPSAQNDNRPAKEVYTTFVGELWFGAREGMESGQVKGFSRQSIMEFCSREYEMIGKRFKIERKEDMKKRMRYSPDHADADVGCVEVARRNGLEIQGKVGQAQQVENLRSQKRSMEVLGIVEEKPISEGGWSSQDIRGDRESFEVIQWQ